MITNVITDKTQNARLLRLFKDGKEITSMSAFMLMGITQLGARIKELEAKGYSFNRPWIDLPTGKRVKLYSLKKCSACNGTGLKTDVNGVVEDDVCPECDGD